MGTMNMSVCYLMVAVAYQYFLSTQAAALGEERASNLAATRKRRAVFVTDNGFLSREHAGLNAASMSLADMLFNGISGPGKRSSSGFFSQQVRPSKLYIHILPSENSNGDEFDVELYQTENMDIPDNDAGFLAPKRKYNSADDSGYTSRIAAADNVAQDQKVYDDIFGKGGAGRR